jgi:hypothetical protein
MYAKIHDSIWRSLKHKKISPLGKTIFIYLCSCTHHNIIGFYHLPLAYISSDLGEQLDDINATVKELLANGLINYDYDNEVVLVKGFLEHNTLVNTNAEKSAVIKVCELPDTPLLQEFLTVLEQLANRYETVILTVEQRLAIQNTETEEETVTVTEGQKEETETRAETAPASAQPPTFLPEQKEKEIMLPDSYFRSLSSIFPGIDVKAAYAEMMEALKNDPARPRTEAGMKSKFMIWISQKDKEMKQGTSK